MTSYIPQSSFMDKYMITAFAEIQRYLHGPGLSPAPSPANWELFAEFHGAVFSQAFMEAECFFENMRGLGILAGSACSFVVVEELVTVIRGSNVIDDNLCSFLRIKATNISYAVFRDEYVGIMFSVVDVGAERNDCGNLAALSCAV